MAVNLVVYSTLQYSTIEIIIRCHLTLLALDYSPSDRPDCHKNSLRFTKIKFQEKAFERHAEQRERSAQKNKKYISLVGSFTISAQGA